MFVGREIGASAQGRSLELWIVAGDAAPQSLGALAADENINEITTPENLRDQLVGAMLAISDEPVGGWPTGAILAAGKITTI